MKSLRIHRILSIVCFIMFAYPALAEIPQTINYQGFLTGADGTPVTGTHAMTFALYDVQTGGTALWSETHNAVDVQDGVYSVSLGSITSLSSLPFDVPYFLDMSVDDQPFDLRQPLTSVPYALRAAAVDTGGTVTVTSPNSELNLAGGETYLYDVVQPDPALAPDLDGFRIRRDADFFGPYKDALVIEKTDGNSLFPDGGIAFVNTGVDDYGTETTADDSPVSTTSLVITGKGLVGIGKTTPLFSLDLAGNLNVDKTVIIGGNLLMQGPQPSLFGNSDQTMTIYPNGSALDSRSWMVFWGADGGARAGELEVAGTALNFRSGSTTTGYGNVGMRLTADGKLGIGTTDPAEMLTVNGMIKADGLIATGGQTWPDQVFESQDDLMPLEDVAAYIQHEQHLPNVPTQEEVAEQGVNVVEMQATLLKKVEELTLHVIALKQESDRLKQENEQLNARISVLEQSE